MTERSGGSSGTLPTQDQNTSEGDGGKNENATKLMQHDEFPGVDEEDDPLSYSHGRRASIPTEEISLLMREQDADILERSFASGANATGMTPQLVSRTTPASVRDVPCMSLDGPDPKGDPEVNKTMTDKPYSKDTQPQRSSETSRLKALDLRRTLSGEAVESQHDELEHELSTSVHSETNEIQGGDTAVAENQYPALERSESMNRRISEVAQYAEVVGDAVGELVIIDEDIDDAHDDDDEDEGATEIHVVSRVHRGDSGNEGGTPPKPRRRPQWPLHSLGTKKGFFDSLLEKKVASQHFVWYQGIKANPPDVVKSGTDRGNYAQLHRKAWLEVSDKYHRYGKNLRLYYRYWERLGFPTNSFFDWIDSKGEAAGQPLPALPDCPRSELDADTVLYISDREVSKGYALQFAINQEGRGIVTDVDGDLVRSGPDGWIFVLRDNVMYGAQKITSVTGHAKQRFHHSSFFGGKAVAAAGIFITNNDGVLTRLYPHSGHYRPGEAHMQRVLFFLYQQGVDLNTVEMDMQQIMHVARDTDVPKTKDAGGDTAEKKKKIDSLQLVPAVLVACFLAHKARCIGEGIFAQIHRIRQVGATTVTEALEVIDDGGCW